MNKYHNKKTTVDGITYDSRREAERSIELRLMERAGEITNLRRQVRFEVIPTLYVDGRVAERKTVYIADFVYTDKRTGETVVEDVKGVRTKEYALKRKLMLEKHGIRIREV